MKNKPKLFKSISISVIWFWLSVFALTPIALTLIISLADQEIKSFIPTISNYSELFNTGYLKVFIHSLSLSTICTLICLVIGYPFSFIISRTKSAYRSFLLLLVIIPFWTSSLIRTYAIMAILKAKGILNTALLTFGLINQPLELLYSTTAVIIGTVYDLLPFMILPLYTSIEKLDQTYLEAAKDLGASWSTIFIKIIIPLTIPGIIAGSLLVFLPSMTMFYIPVLLGGAKNMLIGNLIEHQFLSANNWPLGTAISMVITLIMAIFIVIYWHNSKEKDRENLA